MFSVSMEYTIFRLFIGVLEDAEYTEQSAVEFSLRWRAPLSWATKKLPASVTVLFPASRSRRLETLWGIARDDLNAHWVNTEDVSVSRSLFMKSFPRAPFRFARYILLFFIIRSISCGMSILIAALHNLCCTIIREARDSTETWLEYA